MFLSSFIGELCTKEENNKAGCTLTFGGQCILTMINFMLNILRLWLNLIFLAFSDEIRL